MPGSVSLLKDEKGEWRGNGESSLFESYLTLCFQRYGGSWTENVILCTWTRVRVRENIRADPYLIAPRVTTHMNGRFDTNGDTKWQPSLWNVVLNKQC